MADSYSQETGQATQTNSSDSAKAVVASKQEKRFALCFCILFVCFGAMVFTFKRTDLFPWLGSCNAAGYDAEHYLAYCHSTRYGDYEHYAFYNATEPRAIDALKQASVLFLGNSNTQYAFSTKPVIDYFAQKQLTHYVMGFGQGAQSPVAQSIIEKHQLQPQMIVANVDPFFSTETNGTFTRVLEGGDKLKTEFERKRQLQRWQARVCINPDSGWHRWLCKGSAETIYRSRDNGHWLTDYYRDNQRLPVSELAADSEELMLAVNAAQLAANEFIERANVARQCVVLTVTPRTGTPLKFAQALASRLQLPLVTPQLDNLVTIDHSHLDKDSARRWSSAFISGFDQYVDECIGNSTVVTANTSDNE